MVHFQPMMQFYKSLLRCLILFSTIMPGTFRASSLLLQMCIADPLSNTMCSGSNVGRGNRAKEIESIELKQCYVIKEFHNKKEDVLIVKYLTEENIVCSFSILLEKMREFEFIEGSPKRKVKPGLTLPCVS